MTKRICLEKELNIDSVMKSGYGYEIKASIILGFFNDYESTLILRKADLVKLCDGEKNLLSLVGKKLVINLKQKNYRSHGSFRREKNRNFLKVSRIQRSEEGSPRTHRYTIKRQIILDSHCHERADFHPTVFKAPIYYLTLPVSKEEFKNLKQLPEFCSFKLDYKLK